MRKHFLLLVIPLLLSSLMLTAQTRKLSGKVIERDSKDAVVGASVSLKGSNRGTIADADGNFSLDVRGAVILSVSSIGYTTIEVNVDANQTAVEIIMTQTGGLTANEVVVAAFGMSRQKKALGYSVTQLDGDQFTQSRTANIGNALSGKVAGVVVTPPATGAGGSSRVVIRGGSSLSGVDQPLYVINGVPMESNNLGSAGLWGGNDAGDGLASINPDDIESISVLKGNTAGALYGSRASNGVILITTKSGRARKGIGVTFNSNITIDNVVDETDFQKEYGPGNDGQKPANQNDAINFGNIHWGGKLDGSQIVQFDGVSRPYSDVGESMKDFYRTGFTLNNSLAMSGGNETGNYRFAVSDLQNNDIMPNATFRRQTINFNINSRLKKLTLEASGQYTKQKAKNRPRLSDSPGNGNLSVSMFPNTLPFAIVKGDPNKPGALPDGTELRYQGNTFQTNPYWAAYQFYRLDETDRFLGNISLKYNVTDWLYAQVRLGTDFQTRDAASSEAYGTAYKPRGDYNEDFTTIRQDNYDLFVGALKNFGDFSIDAFVGGTKTIFTSENKGGGGNDLVVPFVHSVRNVAAPSFRYGYASRGINSVFGSANIGYKKYIYLNVTGRQDRFSTLSPEDNSIIYPSVGISFIASDAFTLPEVISFAKLRTSWAEVGGGAPDPYQLLLSYGLVGVGHSGGNLGQITNGSIPNQTLKPYSSKEIEIGADIRFLNNRFGIDIAYYKRKLTDDILNTGISATSGFGSTTINFGELENRGIEILLTGSIIKKKDFEWDMTVNYAYNKSEALNLGLDASGNPIKNQGLDQSRLLREQVAHVVGKPLGMITGYKHAVDSKGEKIYTAEGYPVTTPGFEVIAEGVHPVSAGIGSNLRYKNIRLEFLIDIRSGGHVMSGTNYTAYSRGLHKETLKGRNGDLQVSGVLANGTPLNVTVAAINIDNYWQRYAQVTENVVYDASFGKLRQASISYTLPSKLLNKTPLESLTVSLVGRNLLLLWSNVPNIDPESAYTVSARSQGLEYFAMPQTRSFGLNLSVNF